MALAALDLSDVVLPADPRLAVVGTPCEVQGLRAMQLRPWPTGAHRVDAVSLSIALFCTKSFDYEALVVGELERTRGIAIDQVARIDVTQRTVHRRRHAAGGASSTSRSARSSARR